VDLASLEAQVGGFMSVAVSEPLRDTRPWSGNCWSGAVVLF
jgi:hypothetical protein